ncbi:hypothetical protein COCSUDRAFT_59793 [Coccomyxa subellipsoidea C-169]|uniref:Apple domain-containing protein n=1 Tax=Coccomyxa subellipsoidea (strain C-169) TaxID=574566 RepID=I0YKE6_COCSC|nr:hypothetical protein COCSUDRAFT_59793 [Coccomyxa subellipsoidea C-169]EIE18865.1 hypothetical protein COCSUDRAFT_59793 [Coccomyxa subellipsoidea C-169]|eukprot:XP_005643409.1 hypothetical protein COCSUDRAFT_59793 [Coccomyxa subellipsoidea C-169]
MSLESLGSLARTVNDRFLRDNLRRIISGTNVSISSVLDGFRGPDSDNENWAEPLQSNEPQTLPSAFEDLARGGSYARQGSDNMLKRRNSSVGRRPSQLQRGAPDGASRAPELRTIYSAASLGYPVSPRAQRKPAGKDRRQQQQKQQQKRWKWSKIATAAFFIAWAILGICFLTGAWLPQHEPDLMHVDLGSGEGQSQAASWRLLSLLHPGNPRRLLKESQVKPHNNMGTAAHRQHGTDAFTAAAARVQHQHAAGRWGQHMSSRMSRSLAEGDASAAGDGASATAEAPSIATAAAFRPGQGASAGSVASKAGAGNGGAVGTQSEAERAAAAGNAAAGGGGSGASVGGAAFVGASLLQQDASAAEVAQQTPTAEGQANTLQYSNGYVNVTGPHYRVVQHTQNRDVCAAACAGDSACAAWTRIAAGRSDVQSCYLKSAVADLAAARRNSAVQYVAPNPTSQVVLESGTKEPNALPAALYGCPYPPSRNGGCNPPPTCNCYQGVCYGDC